MIATRGNGRNEIPLFVLRNADLQSTADQAVAKQGDFTSYIVRRVVAKRVSGGPTVACAGGIYTAAAKGGDALVAAAQSWAGVSGANKLTDATIAAVSLSDLLES